LTTPTLADPLSSVLAMIISANACFGQGGAQFERDRNGPPTPAVPPSFDSGRYISPDRIRQSEGGSTLPDLTTSLSLPASDRCDITDGSVPPSKRSVPVISRFSPVIG
jgi:hypothetical protein